jgi:hypothetical protein
MTGKNFAAEAADGEFRVLVNGFAHVSFASMSEALRSIPAKGADDQSFEIYDVAARRFVWSLPRQQDRHAYRAPHL